MLYLSLVDWLGIEIEDVGKVERLYEVGPPQYTLQSNLNTQGFKRQKKKER